MPRRDALEERLDMELEEASEKDIESLLQPLGFHLAKGVDNVWRVLDMNSQVVLGDYSIDSDAWQASCVLASINICRLWKMVAEALTWSMTDKSGFPLRDSDGTIKRVKNVYFGCKSLEEAMVRKDLCFLDGARK